jgi:hypothetical protein
MSQDKIYFDPLTKQVHLTNTTSHLIWREQGVIPPSPLFNGWSNVSWDTFTSSGINVLSAIKTSATKAWANTNLVEFTVGEKIQVNYNLTLNSGSFPANTVEIHLMHEFNGLLGTITLNPMFPYGDTFTITNQSGSMNFYLRYQNYDKITGHISNSSCQLQIYKV